MSEQQQALVHQSQSKVNYSDLRISPEKNRKVNDLLDSLEFNQVIPFALRNSFRFL